LRKALLAAALLLTSLSPVLTRADAALVMIRVLSSRADLVSGGNAVVAISLPKGSTPSDLAVDLNGRDVTDEFAVRPNGKIEGLVAGLRLGANTLTASLADGSGARLLITNHPNGGPVFAGPQLQPWKCEAGAVDKQCNKPPVFTYQYMSTDATKRGLQPYDPGDPPSDVATTKTDQGITLPFIVRQELGYQDRDQYKILTLFRPGQAWSRWAPQEQWNHKLLVTHGGGCGAARGAGNAPMGDLSGTFDQARLLFTDSYLTALGRGFAVMSTALDNNGHNCNIALQAESLLMAKEHLIKAYGDVRYTIGTGCSGGSITQHQVANAYPRGVYDGLIVSCAYPDSISTGTEFADYHMLRLYFEDPSKWDPGIAWTPSQWAAVEGRPDPVNAIVADEEFFKGATAPSGNCVDGKVVYNASSNPGGVRCSILDAMINVLGPRPKNVWSPMEKKAGKGFAGQPFGNEGVQYGLDALRLHLITTAQFLDLNAKIGGLDIDGTPVPQRIVGDKQALTNSYRSGAINEANNMDTVAIIDHAGPDPGLAHDYVHTWWMRWRLNREFGTPSGNHVLWIGKEPIVGNIHWMNEALLAMDRWLAAVEKDHSSLPLARKIVLDRPADVHDRCELMPDAPPLSTDTICPPPLLQTRYGTPHTVAGGPDVDDINKCALKPLVRSQEPVSFSDDEWAQMQKIFPTGVCDWDAAGVGQQPTIPWQTYQDGVGNVIYGGTPLGPPPVSKPF
jgi:hypothetical protein